MWEPDRASYRMSQGLGWIGMVERAPAEERPSGRVGGEG